MQLSRGNIVLLVVLALAGSFIWFYERDLPTTDEVKAGEGQLLPGIKPGRVDVVYFTAGDTRWAIHRTSPAVEAPVEVGMYGFMGGGTSGNWRLGLPLEDEADPEAVDRLLTALLTGKSAVRLALRADDSLDSFGLARPRAVIRLRLDSGREPEILLGGQAPLGGGIYAMVRGEEDIRVLDLGPEVLAVDANALRRRELLGSKSYAIENVVINGQLEFQRAGAAWTMVRPAALAVRRGLLEQLMSALSSARIERFADSGPAPTVTVALTAGDSSVTELRFAPPAAGSDVVFATLSSRPGWFAVRADLLAPLQGGALDFAEQSFAPIGVYDLASATVIGSGRNDRFERSATGDWPPATENALKALLLLPLRNYELMPAAAPPLPVDQAAYTMAFTRYEGDPYLVYAWREGADFVIWRAGEPAKAKLAANILLPTLAALKP